VANGNIKTETLFNSKAIQSNVRKLNTRRSKMERFNEERNIQEQNYVQMQKKMLYVIKIRVNKDVTDALKVLKWMIS